MMTSMSQDPGRRCIRPALGLLGRASAFVLSLAVVGMPACGPAEPETPIPRPTDLSGVDPWVAHEIEKAHDAVAAAPRDAARWTALGHLYYAHDYADLAISAYSESLALAPRQPRASYMLAVTLRKDGDPEVALDELEQTLELDAETPHLRWRAAEWLIEAGDLERAAEMAEEAVRLGPGDRNSIRMLARTRLEQGRPKEAIEILSPLVQRNPGDLEVRSLRARAFRAAGMIREGARDMLLSGDVKPTWFDDWINQALARRTDLAWWIRRIQRIANQGNPAAARPMLVELRKWHPDAPEVAFTEGVVLLNEGRLDAAVELFEELAAEDPDWAAARIRAAATRLARADSATDPIRALDDRDAAAAMLEEALVIEPDNNDALGLLANSREMQGRSAEALELRRRLVERLPGHRGQRLRLARLLMATGSPSAAIEILDAAVDDLGPEGPGAMVLRVEALAAADRKGEAATALGLLKSRAPRHPAMGRLESLVAGGGA